MCFRHAWLIGLISKATILKIKIGSDELIKKFYNIFHLKIVETVGIVLKNALRTMKC